MKKIVIAVIAAILIVTVIGYIKIKKNEPLNTSPAISALPTDVALFIQTQNAPAFLTQVGKENIIFSRILNAQTSSLIHNYYRSVSSLLENFPKLKSLLENRTTLIAFRRQGKYDIDALFVIEIKSASDKKKFNRLIAGVIKKSGFKIKPDEYNNTKIYIIQTSDKKIYLSFVNGLLLISPSELLLQNSIRQIINKVSLTSEPEFAAISNLPASQTNATVYVNYANLWTILYPHLSTFGISKFDDLKKFADWSSLDVNMEKNIIRLYGYTSAEETAKKYLHIFQGLDGEKFSVDKILPLPTQEFIIFSYNNFKTFITHYNEFLTAKNLSSLYSNRSSQFKSRYKFNPRLELIDKIGTSITIANVKYSPNSGEQTRYLIIKLEDKAKLQKLFDQYISLYAKSKNIDRKQFQTTYNAPGGVIISIYKLPTDDFFDLLFGELYKIPAHQYYFFLDDYLIMAKDIEDIKNFANAYFTGMTLGKDKNYLEFRKNLTPKSAITYYIKQPFFNEATDRYLNAKTKSLLRSKLNVFFGINNAAIQFYPQKDNLFLTYCYLDYKKHEIPVSYIIWQKKLANNLNSKPFIFINHYTKQKEIFVSDIKGNVYLIDRQGGILWKRKLDEPVFGNIFMIDYYHNGKYQLAFNTKSKIYIIDRKGRDVEKFPISLPAPASASLSIFDYEKDGNYRIFVPCENNKVYLYTKEGNLNPGWIITRTSAPVKRPIQHFVYKGKDYIVFADDIHTYILNRRGEVRIPVKQTFVKASHSDFYLIPVDENHKKPLFLTTTAKGQIVFIDFSGKVKIVPVDRSFSDKHYFLLSDWDGDGKYNYIYLQGNKLWVYNEELKPVFADGISFKGVIMEQPHIYIFSANDKRVGFLTSENLVYLINNKGQISKKFPKSSTTRFTITSLIPGKGYNLLVGNGEFLVNYKL